jgi:hypothetical protein
VKGHPNPIHPNLTAQESTGDGFSYKTYDRLSRAYVNDQGRVNYAGLKAEMPALSGFIDQLADVSPENKPDLFPTEDDRKRYYLTAYNALVLFFAASAYPDRHALWARLGYFRNKDIILGGRRLTLNQLENNIIRKQFLDPRIHFYINCGAKGCPSLKPGAIPQNATGAVLDQAARRFINDPARVRFDAKTGTLYLSKIFDWFSEDLIRYLRVTRALPHPHISQYIALYLSGTPRGSRLSDTARAGQDQVPELRQGLERSIKFGHLKESRPTNNV